VPVAFDGSAAAVITALLAFAGAVWVNGRQTKGAIELAARERKLSTAALLLEKLNEVQAPLSTWSDYSIKDLAKLQMDTLGKLRIVQGLALTVDQTIAEALEQPTNYPQSPKAWDEMDETDLGVIGLRNSLLMRTLSAGINATVAYLSKQA
jgi:hypothetical protein